jgi:hypothetical protein
MNYIKKGDKVYTPDFACKDLINFFKPSGICLEPCYGKGNIYKYLPKNSIFCEIEMGKDFYNFNEKVDWIITNPPYSHFSKFIKHGLTISENSVWLLPTWKIFSGNGLLEKIKEHGGIKHIRHYGTGTKLGWSPLANAIGAIHIQKNYKGDISQSWYKESE